MALSQRLSAIKLMDAAETEPFFLQWMRSARIGYIPYSSTLERPGDRRRFVYYANQRGIHFEIADPAKNYDLVILSARADTSVWSRYPQAKVVYDLIDSYLAIPKTDLKGQLRGLFKFLSRQNKYLQWNHWKAIAGMCQRADAVICSTQEQRRDISEFCPNVHTILDAHMGVTRTTKSGYAAGKIFRIVWEGLPQTLDSLALIKPVLEKLSAVHAMEVHIVTDPEYSKYLGKYGKTSTLKLAQSILPTAHFHEWKESNCADIICACDLAVIPLDLDNPFAAGKPENKMLLFWRMGIPVLASATPAYVRAMQAAGLDGTCENQQEWYDKLEQMITQETYRAHAGQSGKAYIERECSEDSLLARWDAVFASLHPQ